MVPSALVVVPLSPDISLVQASNLTEHVFRLLDQASMDTRPTTWVLPEIVSSKGSHDEQCCSAHA